MYARQPQQAQLGTYWSNQWEQYKKLSQKSRWAHLWSDKLRFQSLSCSAEGHFLGDYPLTGVMHLSEHLVAALLSLVYPLLPDLWQTLPRVDALQYEQLWFQSTLSNVVMLGFDETFSRVDALPCEQLWCQSRLSRPVLLSFGKTKPPSIEHTCDAYNKMCQSCFAGEQAWNDQNLRISKVQWVLHGHMSMAGTTNINFGMQYLAD